MDKSLVEFFLAQFLMCISIGNAIKQLVHAFSSVLSSYGIKKLKLLLTVTLSNSYASFVLSKLSTYTAIVHTTV